MSYVFSTIAIIGKPRESEAFSTHRQLYTWLKERQFNLLIEHRLSTDIHCHNNELATLTEIGEKADLAIVVGGDGNMLGAARVLSRFDIAVIGVNKGNLGFLTDLDPDNFEKPLLKVLQGEYKVDERTLLQAEVHRHGLIRSQSAALNETVLHPSKLAHMIQFEVYIDDNFAYSQRSDGLIMSTQTGSTAYSLSGGGSIIVPELDAITLIPMYPHTLSSRPLVLSGAQEIKLVIAPDNLGSLSLSCDGQVTLPAEPGDQVIIKRNINKLQLIHTKDYNFYHVLRHKLGWSSRLF